MYTSRHSETFAARQVQTSAPCACVNSLIVSSHVESAIGKFPNTGELSSDLDPTLGAEVIRALISWSLQINYFQRHFGVLIPLTSIVCKPWCYWAVLANSVLRMRSSLQSNLWLRSLKQNSPHVKPITDKS